MKPILIVYATREGHTRHIAEHLAEMLRARNVTCELVDAATAAADFPPAKYSAAIVGASLHAGKHESEMIRFVKRHLAELQKIPSVFLSVSLAEATVEDAKAPPEVRVRAQSEVRKAIDRFLEDTGWHPSQIAAIAGALPYTKYSFVIRFVMRLIAKKAGGPVDTSRDYEFTDWAGLDRLVDEFLTHASIAIPAAGGAGGEERHRFIRRNHPDEVATVVAVASPREFSPRFWALIGATFLGFVGMGTVLPALAPHVRNDLGGSDHTVGFVIGIFSVVALASRLVSGPVADGRGRKVAFLTGLGSCTIAGAVYLLPIGLTGIWVGRCFQGLGEACLYTGAAAWAVELAGTERSAQALGYLSSGIWGGLSAGPVVGNWLGTFHRAAFFQMLAGSVGFLMLTRVPEHFTPHKDGGAMKWPSRSLLMPGLAVGFVNVHYPVVTGFLILHLARYGNSGPAAFTAYAGAMLCSRFFLGGLPDRVHPRVTFFFGLTAMAIGLLVLAAGPRPAIAVTGAALLGLGFSFPFSSIASTVMRRSPNHERGATVGTLSAFYDLFVGAGSFAAGAVAGRFGYSATFLMAAAALLASAVAGWFVLPVESGQGLLQPSNAV